MALINRGDHSFLVKGSSAKWNPSRWDLDRVTIDYQGSAANLAAFIAALTLGASYSGDSNMKLDDWNNDDHPQWPTVSLIYVGKKGGTLPPDKAGSGYTIQQARFTSFDYKDTDGMWVNITYIAPIASKTKWGTSAVDVGSIGAAAPASAIMVWFTAQANGSWVSSLPTNNAAALSWFVQELATTGDSEELVPGAYYRGTQIKQNLLFSTQF